MNDPKQIYDYWVILPHGIAVTRNKRTEYDSFSPRSPSPKEPDELPPLASKPDTKRINPDAGKVFRSAVGSKSKLNASQQPASVLFHERLLKKITIAEYENLYGGLAIPGHGVKCCRSAYKIINTGTKRSPVMDYDWVLRPVFADFESYLLDVINYDKAGAELSRRRPVAGESFLSGFQGSEVNV